MTIRVLVVDDSAVVRIALSDMLGRERDIEVIATACDPYQAADKVKQFEPDVITLDVEMPRMDGLTFLRKLMAYRPTPVIMISSHTAAGSEIAEHSLGLGAFDFVEKPQAPMTDGLQSIAPEILAKVRAAARANADFLSHARIQSSDKTAEHVSTRERQAPRGELEPVVCIGASAGGTVAIEYVLRHLPPTFPAVVIAQHMPKGFTSSFADRLNSCCAIQVFEAEEGMRVVSGRAVVAQGDLHLSLKRDLRGFLVELGGGPLISGHRPSVDHLFRSAAASAGASAVGVLLTGMGVDGALGLAELHRTGALTMAQDEATSVVYGMPRAAVELGAVERIVSLPDLPLTLNALFPGPKGGRT